jgi:hypothetical protein
MSVGGYRSKLIPTNANNPCPICDDTTGKCRQGRDDADYWQCMSSATIRKGDTVAGYKCLGQTKDGLWGQFRIHQEITPQEREENRRQRQSQRERAASERRAKSLPALERDRLYREILSALELHPDDRADLIRRGFTPEQIALCGFRSVERYQPLPRKFPHLLGGVSECGSKLIVAHPGYLCPLRDREGLIVGVQLRLRTLPEGQKNRYRWLSSEAHNVRLYPDGCDLEGENPLAVFRPSPKPDGIALVEGSGAKPFLLSQRKNLFVVGAPGGQWASSPTLLKDTLERAKSVVREGTNTIDLYPDAGDVNNRAVRERWVGVAKLLHEWGYTVRFAWWGQFAKDTLDADEISPDTPIAWLTPDQFRVLVNPAKAQEKTPTQSDQAKAEAIRAAQLQREIEESHWEKLTRVLESPWKEVNTHKIDLESLELESGVIYLVKSAKGTAKTEGLNPIVKAHKNVFAWFNRIALGREAGNRIGLQWKDDLSIATAKGIKVGFCPDSAHQFHPKQLADNGLFLADECDQVFAHMFGDTCNKGGKRPMVLASLKAQIHSAIAGGGKAILLSADITQRDIDYVRQLAPKNCPVRLIVNHYKPPRGTVLFDESEKPDGQIERLLEDLENNIPCFVVDDIKNGVRGCKSIAEYVRTIHPEWADQIVEINSDTSGDPEIIQFLKNINQASMKVRLVCCSPSVVSGISITNGRFNAGVYAFLNGILTVSDASQAIARVRGAITINVWAAEQGLIKAANGSIDPTEIKGWYQRNYRANVQHILSFGMEYDPLTHEWDSPHFELFCKISAYRNLCMLRLRERLKTRLEEEGYTLVCGQDNGSDMTKRGLTESWTKIELEEAHAVANANILPDEKLQTLSESAESLTPEEKLDIQKTLLLKWFGQSLIDSMVFTHKESGETLTGFAAMHLKNARDVYRKQLEAFYNLRADEGEVIARDVGREKAQLQHGDRFAGDVRWRTNQRKTRIDLGLSKFLKPDEWYSPADFEALAAFAKQHALVVKDVLNLSVEKLSAGQIYGELMNQIGLGLTKQWATDKGGKKQRYKLRRINQTDWQYAQLYVAHKEALKAEREAAKEAATQTITVHTYQMDGVKVEQVVVGKPDTETVPVRKEPTEEDLIETLRKELAQVASPTTFEKTIAGQPPERIEAAILFQEDISQRQKLSQAWEQSKPRPSVAGNPVVQVVRDIFQSMVGSIGRYCGADNAIVQAGNQLEVVGVHPTQRGFLTVRNLTKAMGEAFYVYHHDLLATEM